MTPPPALSPSLEEIAAWHREEAEIYATGTAVLEEDDRPEEAARERAEAKMHADFASALRSLAEVLAEKDAEIGRLHGAIRNAAWMIVPPDSNPVAAYEILFAEVYPAETREALPDPDDVTARSLGTPTENPHA